MHILDFMCYGVFSIVSIVGGFCVWLMILKARIAKIDILTAHSWMAIRVAKDKINKDSRGTEKMNIAMKILRRKVGGKEEDLEDAIRAAVQQMHGLV